MSDNFHFLTNCAASNVIPDEHCHSWPPVVALDQFECFKVTGMAAGQSIVVLLYKFSAWVSIGWDVASVPEE